MLTTKKVMTGEFEVYWNGVKTAWRIINGSMGLSGRNTANIYLITKGEKIIPVGSLQACRKCLVTTLQKGWGK